MDDEDKVYCEECIHRPVIKSIYEDPKPPIRNGKFDETCPYICRQKWEYSRMPKDTDFCSKGEKK